MAAEESPRVGPRSRLAVFLVASAVGLALAWLVPESWVFVPSPTSVEGPAPGDDSGYACPMFCTVLDELPPGGKCPVCGMELGPVSAEALLDRHEQWATGLETAVVARVPLVKELRLTGEVDYDETRIAAVSTRASGWVEVLTRKVSWEEVEEGETLFELYAPDVWAAQSEYLVAQRLDADILAAARQKLVVQYGLTDDDLATIVANGPMRRVPYRAPRRGVIVRRSAIEGAHVGAGSELFAVADLARVWLQMEAFETDLAWMSLGTRLEVRAEPGGAAAFQGVVSFVDPVVDRRSRVRRVRIEVENHRRDDGTWAFVPGQRVAATARVPVGPDGRPAPPDADPTPVLALPRSALLRTGRRSVTFILFELDAEGERTYDLDPDRLPSRVGYELVELRIGALASRAANEGLDEHYPVLGVVPSPSTGTGSSERGVRELRAGLVVVTKGALLLDSQAQLAGRPSLFYPEGRAAAGDAHSGH